jgi:hypothetical protein
MAKENKELAGGAVWLDLMAQWELVSAEYEAAKAIASSDGTEQNDRQAKVQTLRLRLDELGDKIALRVKDSSQRRPKSGDTFIEATIEPLDGTQRRAKRVS